MNKVSETKGSPQTNERKVCSRCIGDEYLKKVVKRFGENSLCFYCDSTSKTITIEILAKHIKKFFEDHFILDTHEPTPLELEMQGYPEPNVNDTIQIYAEVDVEIADDLQRELQNMPVHEDDFFLGITSPFDEEAHYNELEIDSHFWNSLWNELKKTITKENRLFNSKAKEILNLVFKNTLLSNSKSKRTSAIVEIGPDMPIKSLFRAREFQSHEKFNTALCQPDRELGPPPSSLAIAGRMNAKGVAVFYGATDSKVAISEIRPAVGSKVVVAQFDITRKLKLLDIAKLEDLIEYGSLFKPSQKRALGKKKFISSLCEKISAPVMPQDESEDYLITQAISDYLSDLASPTSIDGIIYRSAQVGSDNTNVVLFHKSSLVECREKPIEARVVKSFNFLLDSDDEDEYHVYEMDEIKDSESKESVHDIDNRSYDFNNDEKRISSLRLDPSNIWVYHIRHVDFDTPKIEVRRYHSQKEDVSDDIDF